MNQVLPKKVKFIIDELMSHGYEAYIVGGCVRDRIMGIVPHDYDITTSAQPCEIKSIFKNTADTGIKHGTVTVIIENKPFEVTTFRSEFGYSDSRHPDKVKFINNIEEDLKRRDFSMNAIAFNPEKGFCDPFNGTKDIKNKIIRAVGDPKERFKEDALRILRLFRFKSVLNFSIEKNTEIAALELCGEISGISEERISGELIKTLLGQAPKALEPLIKNGGFKFLDITHCERPERIKELTLNPEIRLYAFLNICGADVFKTCKALKLSNKFFSDFNDFEILKSELDINNIKRNLRKLKNKNNFILYLDYKKHILNEDISSYILKYNKILDYREPYEIKHLKINGDDLKNIGIKGKEIGETLDFLLEKVTDDPKLNNKDKLLEIIKSR
mgnify:CR=1 FL=1